MKYKIFDTHAHYNDEAFNEDREELLSGLFERNEPNGPGSCMEQAETMGENGQRAKRDERNEMSNPENCRRQEEGAMGENGVCTVVEVSAEFGNIMELRLPLEMSPGREAACRAVFGTWGFFRTMHGKTAPSC